MTPPGDPLTGTTGTSGAAARETAVARGRATRRARLAVAALFFANGAAYASWVPRIPEVKIALGLGDGALGAALLGTGAGALVGSLLAAPLIGRRGSRGVAAAVAVAASAVAPADARGLGG